MIVTPLRRQPSRPVALICPAWRSVRVFTADGETTAAGPGHVYDLLASLSGHALYVAGSLRPLLHTTGSLAWTADLWRGRPASLHLYGTTVTVTSLRGTLGHVPEPSDQFAALLEVSEWLSHQGVRAGSVSSIAWSLWRRSLVGPLEIGFDPKVGRSAFYGGRQEAARPLAYADQVALDIGSAYPAAMVAAPYAGLLREVSATTALTPDAAGLARARVTVPHDLRFPTLPVRVGPEMIQWRWGSVEGTWPWRELVAARSLGCEVEVSRCWAPVSEVSPFGPWWAMMRAAREAASPAAVKLVKALTNTLWGCFAMTGDDRETIRWTDDHANAAERVVRPPRRMPQANTIHLAAETTSRLRTRMLVEGLYASTTSPVHIDTDGIIVPASSLTGRLLGTEPGEWRVKTRMPLVEVKAPQLYRYLVEDEEPKAWHYVASGTPARHARELFEGGHPGFQIAVAGFDTVLPASATPVGPEQVSRYRVAAATIEREVFGERMVARG